MTSFLPLSLSVSATTIFPMKFVIFVVLVLAKQSRYNYILERMRLACKAQLLCASIINFYRIMTFLVEWIFYFHFVFGVFHFSFSNRRWCHATGVYVCLCARVVGFLRVVVRMKLFVHDDDRMFMLNIWQKCTYEAAIWANICLHSHVLLFRHRLKDTARCFVKLPVSALGWANFFSEELSKTSRGGLLAYAKSSWFFQLFSRKSHVSPPNTFKCLNKLFGLIHLFLKIISRSQ